jgi:hypothetical protein
VLATGCGTARDLHSGTDGTHGCGGSSLTACDGGVDAGPMFPPGECVRHADCLPDQRCIYGTCLTDPPACGRPYDPACSWETSKDDCYRLGGEWVCGYFNPTDCHCHCPTNDYKCPCWKESHCQGKCMGERVACDGTKVIGYCSQTVGEPMGCSCYIYEGAFTQGCGD